MFGLPPLPRTLAAALVDVGDARRSVRDAAVKDLGRLVASATVDASGDALRARDELCRLVTDSEHADVRGEAALELADVGDVSALAPLTRAARDANVRVREMALIALGELATEAHSEVRQVVKDALTSQHVELRFQALLIAGRVLGDEELAPILVQSLSGADAQIRYRAVRVADERWLATPSSAPLPSAPPPVPLSLEPPRAIVAMLKNALGDRELSVRVAVALALGKLLTRDANVIERSALIPVLLDGLEASTLELEDEEAVIEVVAAWRVQGAERALNKKAWGFVPGRFAWQARIALAQLGDRKARTFLVSGLSARGRESRLLAIVAVGRAGIREAGPALQRLLAAGSGDEKEAAQRSLHQLSELATR